VALLVVQVACGAPPLPPLAGPPTPERYRDAADPDPAIRARGADGLVADPAPEATELLLVLQQRDIDPSVRAHAADAIARRRDPRLEAALDQSAQGDPDPRVRAAAARARDRLWPWDKGPNAAAGWSLLCPGCGQLYLRNYATGAAQLAATAGLIAGGAALISGHTIGLDTASDSAAAPIGLQLAQAGQNMWFYSIFDAYRTARALRDDAGYRHPITRESLAYLASAPFRPSVIARPWVWAGVPLALAGALGVSYLADRGSISGRRSIFDLRGLNVLGHNFRSRAGAFAAGETYLAALFDPVGVGEESLFRGFFQAEFDERLGTYGGLAAASGLFGAVHALNFIAPGEDPKQALIAVPVIAAIGSGLGLAYIRTGYKLETSVAMHFWYDFLLSTAAFIVDPEHQPFVVQYGMRL
jgi:membrane protease YdiL (CAAX protease family)